MVSSLPLSPSLYFMPFAVKPGTSRILSRYRRGGGARRTRRIDLSVALSGQLHRTRSSSSCSSSSSSSFSSSLPLLLLRRRGSWTKAVYDRTKRTFTFLPREEVVREKRWYENALHVRFDEVRDNGRGGHEGGHS